MATLCSSTRSVLFGASALAASIYIYRRFHNASAVPFIYAILADINWLSDLTFTTSWNSAWQLLEFLFLAHELLASHLSSPAATVAALAAITLALNGAYKMSSLSAQSQVPNRAAPHSSHRKGGKHHSYGGHGHTSGHHSHGHGHGKHHQARRRRSCEIKEERSPPPSALDASHPLTSSLYTSHAQPTQPPAESSPSAAPSFAAAGLRFVRSSIEASSAVDFLQRGLSSLVPTGSHAAPMANLSSAFVPGQLPRVTSGQCLAVDEAEGGSPARAASSPSKKAADWAARLSDADLEEMREELAEVPEGGAPDGSKWELLLTRSTPTLSYTVWKRPWKNGLNTYKSATTLTGVTPEQLYTFQSDDDLRCKWDANILEFALLGQHQADEHTQLQYWRSKFPRPMAAREYIFVKRSWSEEDGLYSISKHAEAGPEQLPERPGRNHRVGDYCVGTRIFKAPSDDNQPRVCLVQLCHEENGVSAGMINMTLKKGLWSFVQTRE
eukprot:CAMPEP_0118922576 /NCGR_PEP_ID=MMETSP1169-20130426/1459_1 /TAXON_ID=36882 /ORGANISM="Pyramimonas obovata, Strain CCMP722" /LENGTH=496 /DNA_ID=CAMNT_0006863471 /DNA_START=183 /DNA_END=1670 /DNA_ORIENTATION=+